MMAARTKEVLRRVLGILLSCVLVLGMCPTAGIAEQIPAESEGGPNAGMPLETQGQPEDGPTEEELPEGTTQPQEANAQSGDDTITWTNWDNTDSLPSDEGNYRLTGEGDVTIGSTWNVSTNIKLDLDGHKIIASSDLEVITISSPGMLEIYDTSTDGNGQITHASQKTDRCITVYGGTLILRGGKITGNWTDYKTGAGVFVSNGATFIMCGGEISSNIAGRDGYAHGGGVYCDSNGRFEMSGGTIKRNHGYVGGGVYYAGGGASSSFTLSGGTISENKAESGSGIFAGDSFNVFGNPVVSGNIEFRGSTANNIRLAENKQLNIAGELTEGASLGVIYSPAKPYTFTSGYTTAGNADAPSTYFFSDDGGYSVYWSPDETEACLSRERSVTIPSNDLGTVTASVNGTNVDNKAVVGNTVSLSATPNDSNSYTLDAFKVTKTDDPNTTVTVEDDAFTMPDYDVTVTATFRDRHLHNDIDFQPWTSTTSLPTEEGSWYLTDNVTLSSRWDVPEGTTNLCLNGKTITADGDFDAFMMSSVSGGQTRTLSIYDEEGDVGKVTHAESKLGCGVCVSQGCIFNLHGGNITGNTVNTLNDRTGGGVDVYGGTFNMDGGKISSNTAGDINDPSTAYGSGAGVYINSLNDPGTFNMSGGTIEHNKAAYQGGGVCCTMDGILSISGGTIQYNESQSYGGGVYYANHETPAFTLSGGIISNNTSNSVGGIYAGGDFNVSGKPIVKDNTKDGGSASNIVLDSNGAGKKINITDELTTGANMGVTCDKNKPYIFTSGYTTAGNTADPSTYFFSDDTSYSVLWTADGENARLGTARTITVTNTTPDYGTVTASVNGTSSSTAVVGDAVTLAVTPSDSERYTLDELKISYGTGDDAQEKDVTVTKSFDMPDHDVTVTATFRERHFHDGREYFPWKSTDSLPDVMEANSYYYLTDDVTLASTWVAPQLETHLCLNGHSITLSQGGDDPQPVIRVAQHENEIPCSLVLYDEDASEGTITHAQGKKGCGVLVANGGEFVMKGGNISNNNASDYGGGVLLDGGTFAMEGGTIANNKGYYRGGGVAVKGGTFTMKGGTIQNNGDDSIQFGGGVYVKDGTFDLTGGTITQNTARIGGGVAGEHTYQISVSGNPKVTDNHAVSEYSRPMGDNLCLVWPSNGNETPLTIGGALGEDAKIGISAIRDNSPAETLGSIIYTDGVFTTGYKAAQNGDPWNHFTSDDPNREVLWTPDGKEAQLTTPRHITVAQGITGGTVTISKDVAAEGETVAVQATPNEGWELVSVTAKDADKNDVEVKDNKELVVPASDVVVSATFREKDKPATYKVTAKADPEAGGKAEASTEEAAEGASVTLTATSADGYEFVRWTVEGAGARVDDAGKATTKLTVGTADVTATATFRAKGQPGPGPEPTPVPAGATVSYTGHVQDVGDVGPAADGDTCGTTGRGLRLEAIGARVEGGTIEYRGHVQDQGWEGSWAADGATSGTVGKGLRLEAIQMRLAGGLAATHDAFYRVHVQNLGWLGWARDGEVAGTAGKGLRAEAYEVVVLPKGQVPEGYDATDPAFVGYTRGNAHVQGRGWQKVRDESSLLGTAGRGLRMEALSIRPGALPDDLTGSVEYASHVQGVGWEPGWASDGSVSGTTGRALRVEAVRVRLTGDVSARYAVWYRVHVQDRGWSGWACGGDPAGSEGLGLRAEAVELRVLPVGAPVPPVPPVPANPPGRERRPRRLCPDPLEGFRTPISYEHRLPGSARGQL